MFLMTGKGIREGICNFNRYAKANNKYLKDHDKNKESWDVNNFYGQGMLQKLSMNAFIWVEDLLEFDGDFIKSCAEKIEKDIFSWLIFSIQKNCINFIMIYCFYQNV